MSQSFLCQLQPRLNNVTETTSLGFILTAALDFSCLFSVSPLLWLNRLPVRRRRRRRRERERGGHPGWGSDPGWTDERGKERQRDAEHLRSRNIQTICGAPRVSCVWLRRQFVQLIDSWVRRLFYFHCHMINSNNSCAKIDLIGF